MEAVKKTKQTPTSLHINNVSNSSTVVLTESRVSELLSTLPDISDLTPLIIDDGGHGNEIDNHEFAIDNVNSGDVTACIDHSVTATTDVAISENVDRVLSLQNDSIEISNNHAKEDSLCQEPAEILKNITIGDSFTNATTGTGGVSDYVNEVDTSACETVNISDNITKQDTLAGIVDTVGIIGDDDDIAIPLCSTDTEVSNKSVQIANSAEQCCDELETSEFVVTVSHDANGLAEQSVPETEATGDWEQLNIPPVSAVCAPKYDLSQISAMKQSILEQSEVLRARASMSRSRCLYPEAIVETTDDIVAPFTDADLKQFYCNKQLENNEAFIDKFIFESDKTNHIFYTLLSTYYRSRLAFIKADTELNNLIQSYATHVKDVWVEEDNIVRVEGICADGAKVEASKRFTSLHMSQFSLQLVSQSLGSIREFIDDRLSLCLYTVDINRTQIEGYIQHMYQNSSIIKMVVNSTPVSDCTAVSMETANETARLRDCISVLFTFLRESVWDDVFLRDCRSWLDHLVATLLRLGDLDDHLFLLNHILRLPPRISDWAVRYIQLPTPRAPQRPQDVWYLPTLNHSITALATLLRPVRARISFLQAFTPTDASSLPSLPWILVDEDGEELDDTPENLLNFLDVDLVSLLEQFNFSNILSTVLLVRDSQYDVQLFSPLYTIQLFSFIDQLLDLINSGFRTFSSPRYLQFVKRLGRESRRLVYFASDHWQGFLERVESANLPLAEIYTKERCQTEFDHLVLRACRGLLSSSTLQFLSDIPFYMVSTSMLWKIIYLIHCEEVAEFDDLLSSNRPSNDWVSMLHSVDSYLMLEGKLMPMPISETIYLLNSLANMAKSRDESEGGTMFISLVSNEIYDFCYVNRHTREFCSKCGKDVISSIAASHPFIVGELLGKVDETISVVGTMNHYLFQELPILYWLPRSVDLEKLKVWLIKHPISSPLNGLARLILSNMNWGSRTGAISVTLHRFVAFMVLEVCLTHCSTTTAAKGITTEVVYHLKSAAYSMLRQPDEEQRFLQWAWNLLRRLKLHPSQGFLDQSYCFHDLNATVKPVLDAWHANHPIGTFLAVAMTSYGVDTGLIISQGLRSLQSLIDSNNFTPVVQLLSFISPLFYSTPDSIIKNSLFISLLSNILLSEVRLTTWLISQVPGWDSVFPGQILELFAGMVANEVVGSSFIGDRYETSVEYSFELFDPSKMNLAALDFWMSALTNVPNWGQLKPACFLIDLLIQTSFMLSSLLWKRVYVVVYQFYLSSSLNKPDKQGGLLSSVVSWVTSGTGGDVISTSLPSTFQGFYWLSFAVLLAETQIERDNLIWDSVLVESSSGRGSPTIEAAVKRVSTRIRVNVSVGSLCIVRWAALCLEMPVDHPLTPLAWQQFFQLYFYSTQRVETPHGSHGFRFYDSTPARVAIKKKLSKRLESTVYRLKDSKTSDGSQYDGKLQLGSKLIELYTAAELWLNEPRLHDPSLYLPGLPPCYGIAYLSAMFAANTELWYDLVLLDVVTVTVTSLCSRWRDHAYPAISDQWRPLRSSGKPETSECSKRILERIERNADTSVRPPNLLPVGDVIEEVDHDLLGDSTRLLRRLSDCFSVFVHQARLSQRCLHEMASLDLTYTELLPQLHSNQPRELHQVVACTKTMKPSHVCRGPANLVIRFKSKVDHASALNSADVNRVDYGGLMKQCRTGCGKDVPLQAVFLESTITVLINLYKSQRNLDNHDSYKRIGADLFYYITQMVDNNLWGFNPTKQLIVSCIEVLGNVFIQGCPEQVKPLLMLVLSKSLLTGTLAPMLEPLSNPDEFAALYNDVASLPHGPHGDALAFSLLSKFDVYSWLVGSRPSQLYVDRLINTVGVSLETTGGVIDTHNELRHTLLRRHFREVFLHEFPRNFLHIMTSLVERSYRQKLSPLIWDEILECLGFRNDDIQGSPVVNQEVTMHMEKLIPLETLNAYVEWISNYFNNQRLVDKVSLYGEWAPHICNLAKLFSFITRGLIVKEASSLCPPYHLDIVEGKIYLTWNNIIRLFIPWVLPISLGDSPRKGMDSPWCDSDSTNASIIVDQLSRSIALLHTAFTELVPPYGHTAMKLFFPYYVQSLARPEVEDHVLRVYHARFPTLPWESFFPDMESMRLMSSLYSTCPPSSFDFMGFVFPSINWPAVIISYSSHDIEISIEFHVILFKLLVMFSANSSVTGAQGCNFSQLLTAALTFSWRSLSSSGFEEASIWYGNNANCQYLANLVDPLAVSRDDSLGLQLLQMASGFPDCAQLTLDCVKQCCYMRCINTLHYNMLTSTSVQPTPETTNLVVAHQLQLIHKLVALSDNQSESLEDGVVATLSECVNFVNAAPYPYKSTVVNGFNSWIKSTPSSSIHTYLLSAACKTLASDYSCVIAEVCIEEYFNGTSTPRDELAGWGSLLQTLSSSGINHAQIMNDSVSHAAFYALYAEIMLHLPLSQRLEDEAVLLARIVDWTSIAVASLLPSNEHKMLLFWAKIVELMIRQVDYGGSHATVAKQLESLVNLLTILGEDKSSQGFFGSIGLGRKSCLTLACRCVSRCLALYLATQIPCDGVLRYRPLDPSGLNHRTNANPVKPSPLLTASLTNLRAMRSNKLYVEFYATIDWSLEFAYFAENSLRESLRFIGGLVGKIYGNYPALSILQQCCQN